MHLKDRFLCSLCFNLQEFDHPHLLLKNENGYLYKMMQQTGHAVAESLFRAAQMVCNKVWKELAIVLHCQTLGRLEALYFL